MRVVAVAVVFVLAGTQSGASEAFKDVPEDHWAAGAVQKLKDEGIVRGYPDGTFKGDQPVTRYELAAALVRFAEFLQGSVMPPSQGMLPGEKQPRSIESLSGSGKEPAGELVGSGFLPKDSPLAKDGKKPVTSQELADALASVAKRLIELTVPEESGESQPSAITAP